MASALKAIGSSTGQDTAAVRTGKFHCAIQSASEQMSSQPRRYVFNMPETRKPDPELLPIHRPRCPDCQTRMITVAIASAPQGERRTFKCRKCGHCETGIFASDPLNSDAAGWIAGELRPPH